MAQAASKPVVFEVEYSERLSRRLLLLKSFFGWLYVGIPHGVVLYVYGILVNLLTFISFFAILFTGKYPKGFFEFVVGYYRWAARVSAYLLLMVDKYPPFSMDKDYPVKLEVEYPQGLSRASAVLKVFLGWLFVQIPHFVLLFFYAILVAIVLFLSWWTILFTGRFPRRFFDLVVRYNRWLTRVNLYLGLLRDEYPPFNGRP